MHKAAILASLVGLIVITACGVPPEEDVATQSEFKPLGQAYFVPVSAEDLAQSEAWAEVVKEYN